MGEPALVTPVLETAPRSRARDILLRRLADVVCLPSSRINAFERSIVADLLVDTLREADAGERERVARRLAPLGDIPTTLLRLLLHDTVNVARPLLEEGLSLRDGDLIDCIRKTGVDHRVLIARRRDLGELVCEALAEIQEPIVIQAMLRNTTATLSPVAVELIVAMTRDSPALVPDLLKRPELRPSHAYALFWWAGAEGRRTVLQRFAVSREILQDAVSDVFNLATEEGWQDPLSRKALQFIERRQRNRAALSRSRFDSLEAAVSEAERGMTRELSEEISYLSGVKPMTGAKILADVGGEPLAILCKATGLDRAAIPILWRALGRPETNEAGEMAPALERTILTYNTIATDRAQTVLRYWNWALTSALSPALLRAIREGDEDALDEYSVPEKTAMLALAKDLIRQR
jgi:uncharacterized protein (DUF2336 family)